MQAIAIALASAGYMLRSGRAPGADQAFESGAGSSAILYVPWHNFSKDMPVAPGARVFVPAGQELYLALLLASVAHPKWALAYSPRFQVRQKGDIDPVRRLHARNVLQIWGEDLNTPSDFVIAYATIKNGQPQGGTALAMRIAQAASIPVYNLYLPDDIARLRTDVTILKEVLA
jgi:hypothetical protein